MSFTSGSAGPLRGACSSSLSPYPIPRGHFQCPSPPFSASLAPTSLPPFLERLQCRQALPGGDRCTGRWPALRGPAPGASLGALGRVGRAGGPRGGGAGGGARPGRAPRWRVARAPAVPSCPRGARGLIPTPSRSRSLPPAARFVPRLAPSAA